MGIPVKLNLQFPKLFATHKDNNISSHSSLSQVFRIRLSKLLVLTRIYVCFGIRTIEERLLAIHQRETERARAVATVILPAQKYA